MQWATSPRKRLRLLTSQRWFNLLRGRHPLDGGGGVEAARADTGSDYGALLEKSKLRKRCGGGSRFHKIGKLESPRIYEA